MKTYRITEEWIDFQKYLTEYLSHIDISNVCFMSKNKVIEIYIRYSDDRIGKILREKYTLIPCNAPDNFINDGWTLTGNPHLFTD
jgi:hypothetical protein